MLSLPNLKIGHWLGLGALALFVILFFVAKSKPSTAARAGEAPTTSSVTDNAQAIEKTNQIIASLNQDIDKSKSNANTPAVQPPQNPMAQFQAQQFQQMMAQQAAQRAAMNYGAPRREVEQPTGAGEKSLVMSFREDAQSVTSPPAPIVQKAAKDDGGVGYACGSEDDYWSACIPEGSVIQAVTTNELRGDFTGPVMAKVSQPLMSQDKKSILVPTGTVVLGESGRVGGQEQARLAIGFHRMILSEGSAYHRAGWAISLDKLQGLSVDGSAGQEGHVNHHWGSTIAASAAYGLLAGFALSGTGSYLTNDGVDVYRQGISQAAGQQGQQVLSRMMNRMPTITVPVGSECNVYVATDLRMRQ